MDVSDVCVVPVLCLQVARRYKIMNPDKMRTTYGKLMYMLMDAMDPDIQKAIGFSLVKPILTVTTFVEARHGSELLQVSLPYSIGTELGTK